MSDSLFDFLDDPVLAPMPPAPPAYSREEFERDQMGETGEKNAAARRVAEIEAGALDDFDEPLPGDAALLAAAEAFAMPSDPLPLVDPLPAEPALPLQPTGWQGFLGEMFSEAQLNDILSAQVFERVDDDIEVDYRCPCCQYEWSGNPKPKLADQEAELNEP